MDDFAKGKVCEISYCRECGSTRYINVRDEDRDVILMQCADCGNNTFYGGFDITKIRKHPTNPNINIIDVKDLGITDLRPNDELNKPIGTGWYCEKCGWESTWEILAGPVTTQFCIKCMMITKFKKK